MVVYGKKSSGLRLRFVQDLVPEAKKREAGAERLERAGELFSRADGANYSNQLSQRRSESKFC